MKTPVASTISSVIAVVALSIAATSLLAQTDDKGGPPVKTGSSAAKETKSAEPDSKAADKAVGAATGGGVQRGVTAPR